MNNSLVDALAIKLTCDEIEGLKSFGTYQVDSIVKAEVGDRITSRGYPIVDGIMTGPTTLEADVQEILGLSIILSKPSIIGLSGGPATSSKGLVGLGYGDLGTALALTNAVIVPFEPIADYLFK